MNGFYTRQTHGSKVEATLFKELDKLGFDLARNGTEHTHPQFVEKLHRSTDQTSLSIRFQPDGVVSLGQIPKSFYVEVKASTAIEKLAYEQYAKLVNNGNILVLFFYIKRLVTEKWKWQFLQNIRFKDSQQHVNQFNDPYPVIDEWICPREHCNWNKLRKERNVQSGTPYKEIDLSSLFDFGLFYQIIVPFLE